MTPKSQPAHVPLRSFGLPAALGLLTLLGALGATVRPAPGLPIAMVFPPWWNASRTMLAASAAGPVIRLGALPFVAVVAPADAQARAALHHAGAWLLLDPVVLTLCAAPPV